MKIKQIRLSWFRGASENATLETNDKSLVVYGRNGTGKSSFVDGIEYILRNGHISHLAHEYSGRHHKHGVRNTHTPSGIPSTIGIDFSSGETVDMQIEPDGNFKSACSPAAFETEFSKLNFARVVLRQDEIANFMLKTKGEKYSALLPLLGLHSLEVRANNIRSIKSETMSASMLQRKQTDIIRQQAAKDAAFGDKSDEEIMQCLGDLHAFYKETKLPLDRDMLINELEDAEKTIISSFNQEHARHHELTSLLATKPQDVLKSIFEILDQTNSEVDEHINDKLSILESASTYTERLDPEETIPCPACGKKILANDFKEHVENEQKSLQDLRIIYMRRNEATDNLIALIRAIPTRLRTPKLTDWLSDPAQSDVVNKIEQLEGLDLKSLRRNITALQVITITDAITLICNHVNASTVASIPEVEKLVEDKKIISAAVNLKKLDELISDVANLELLESTLTKMEQEVRNEIRFLSDKIITEISNDIQELWSILHKDKPIEDISLHLPDDDKAIDICLKFHGVSQSSPRLTLSEGHKNSLGLCIFLTLAKRGENNNAPIILDDVVTSFDREHRGFLVNLLNQHFTERQIIIFTHDREWFAELRARLPQKKWSFKMLNLWKSPTEGINWLRSSGSLFAEARHLVSENPELAGNKARTVMDIEFSIAAESLRVSLPYLRSSRNDHRTSHEFVTRIAADAKKKYKLNDDGDYVPHNGAIEALQEAERLLVSWANAASHGHLITESEAEELINACESAYTSLSCPECNELVWLANQEGQKRLQCGCGHLRWKYG